MVCMFSCALVPLAVIVALIVLRYIYRLIFGSGPPDSDLGYKESWFGKDPLPLANDDIKESSDDVTIRPFKIDVSEEVLSDLKQRLERTRFPQPIEDVKFFYGFNPIYLKEVVEYWRKEYDWRAQEKELNKYPHFKTRIEGLDIHFMHVKPDLPPGREETLKVIPLMIIHGWPGSFVEFYKMVPMLTTPRPDHDFVFEVICPSIPGFGFSEIPHRKGCNARATARIFITLMERLGFRQFYVQGGDWGSFVATLMAKYYAPRVKGLHLNMVFAELDKWQIIKIFVLSFFPFLFHPTEYNFIYPLKKKGKFTYGESGYFHIQSTKPDTLGAAGSDSPAGLAAWLLEKFSVATDAEFLKLPDGGLTKKFTLDELLTNIMVYWVGNTITSAARFYKENLKDIVIKKHNKMPLTVPTGVAAFPNEIIMMPKIFLSGTCKNLVLYTLMPRGGHFAAMEEPQLLADNIWKFISQVEKL